MVCGVQYMFFLKKFIFIVYICFMIFIYFGQIDHKCFVKVDFHFLVVRDGIIITSNSCITKLQMKTAHYKQEHKPRFDLVLFS